MRTGPWYILSAHRTAVIAAFFVSTVLLLVLFGFVMGSGGEFAGAREPLTFVRIPARIDAPAPGAILTFILGVLISILCLVFGGGRAGRRFSDDRTIGSGQGTSGIVSLVAAPCWAVILFLRPILSAGRY